MAKPYICPHCGATQSGSRQKCLLCGEQLDDRSSDDEVGKFLYYKPTLLAKLAGIVLLALAIVEAVLLFINMNSFNVNIPFISAILFFIAGIGFEFPFFSHKVQVIFATISVRRYRSFAHESEDYDDPYPDSIKFDQILFLVLAAAAVIITAYYLINLNDFRLIPPDITPGSHTISYSASV